MRLAIVANEQLKEEFLATGIAADCTIDWMDAAAELSPGADLVIDLLFEQNGYDVSYLKSSLPKPVIVNSVNKTITEIGLPFIRINGWPGFLQRNIAELACNSETDKKEIEKVLLLMNKKAEWVPDVKGFISARVVSMIINEAYFALEENVSSKEEIDTAMKLGTNYPYGPFEWGKKIGLKNVASLLTELSKTETRYQPSRLLLNEAIEK